MLNQSKGVAINVMQPHYRLEAGKYAFYLKGKRLFAADEVAVLFDRAASVLLQHGVPEFVNDYFRKLHREYGANEHLLDVADNLTVVCGRFEVEELNKVVRICDYVGEFYVSLEAPAARKATEVLTAIRARVA